MTESKRRQSESMISSSGRPSRRSWRSTSSCSSSGSLHFRLVSIMRRLIVSLRDTFEGSRPKAIGSPLGLHLPHMHAEQPVHEELAHEAMPCKQYCDNAKLNMHSIHIQMRTVQHIVCHPGLCMSYALGSDCIHHTYQMSTDALEVSRVRRFRKLRRRLSLLHLGRNLMKSPPWKGHTEA